MVERELERKEGGRNMYIHIYIIIHMCLCIHVGGPCGQRGRDRGEV